MTEPYPKPLFLPTREQFVAHKVQEGIHHGTFRSEDAEIFRAAFDAALELVYDEERILDEHGHYEYQCMKFDGYAGKMTISDYQEHLKICPGKIQRRLVFIGDWEDFEY